MFDLHDDGSMVHYKENPEGRNFTEVYFRTTIGFVFQWPSLSSVSPLRLGKNNLTDRFKVPCFALDAIQTIDALYS